MPQAPPLRPLGGWDLVSRGRFEARHGEHLWTVDLDYFDFGEKLHLYRDGVEVEVQKSPAKFELDGSARIEASMGLLGMRQIDLVADGMTTMLTPVDGTAEAWRVGLARDHPGPSRLIGAVSWVVLVVAFLYELPQLAALVGGALGADFESPFTLPGAANFLLGTVALAAAVERALRFKSSRWL
jgi:hypothetical protein